MAKTKIVDDEYTTVRDDIEKVQTKPTMYISYTGPRAAIHLWKEMVNNVLDEYKNEKNVGDGIVKMLLDESENTIYIGDTGRGIKFEELENACTILHSGTKMKREHGDTAGENGVGLTATNALSELFEITSYREGKMRMLQFKEGKKTIDREQTVEDLNKHGLLVAFKPSKLFLGPCNFDTIDMDLWLTKISFMQPENIKFDLTIRPADSEVERNKIYQNTTGFGGFLEKLEPEYNLLGTPVVLECSNTIMETDIPVRNDDGTIHVVDMNRNIDVRVVMNFKEGGQDTARYSFCNDIETIEHGEHLNGVTNAILSFFKKKIKETSKQDDVDVTNNDILFGLGLAITMNTDYSTGLFTGQTKHKMDNKVFYDPIRKMVMKALDDYFKMPENKKAFTQILSVIRANIRARLAATKSRKSTKSSKNAFLFASLISGLTPPNDIGKDGVKCEIYIIEGDSAGGNAREARIDPNIQGTMALTGKPFNAYGVSDEYMDRSDQTKELRKFFDDILGCGYGDHFDISKLKYDKIIYMPDADTDGDHIMGVSMANIYRFARPLIEQGHVYRAITPLYRLKMKGDKKRERNVVNKSAYLYSKDEYFGKYEERASELIRIRIDGDDNFVSRTAMKKFLKTNRDYYQQLDTMARHYTFHPDLIEWMAYRDDFRESISEFAPEMKYRPESDSFFGIYDGDVYKLILNDIFLTKLQYLKDVIDIGNDGMLYYHVYKSIKTKSEFAYQGTMTIGQIMALCQTAEPEIRSRYKGQGELEPHEIRALAMDPDNRTLIRMTINDVERTTSIMDDLFLESRRNVRKELVANSNITVDEIDN